MKRLPDSNAETSEILLRELGKSALPNSEQFEKNLLVRLEKERIRPSYKPSQAVPWYAMPWMRFAYAAVIPLLLIVSGTYWYYSATKPIAIVAVALGKISAPNLSSEETPLYPGDTIHSDAAGQASLLLSDYSLIRIDTQSALQLTKQRNIQLLEGRLFAEVARTSNRDQFRIHANDISVIVLGTSFEVDVQKEKTVVTVYEGSVQVDWSGQSKTLTTGDSLSVSMKDKHSQMCRIDENMPDWAKKLYSMESCSPIIKAMREHFPSRSLDI